MSANEDDRKEEEVDVEIYEGLPDFTREEREVMDQDDEAMTRD